MIHCIFSSSNKTVSRQTKRCDIKKYTLKGMFSQCLMKVKEAAPLVRGSLCQHEAEYISLKLRGLLVANRTKSALAMGLSLLDPGSSLLLRLLCCARTGLASPGLLLPMPFHISLPLHIWIPLPEFPFFLFLPVKTQQEWMSPSPGSPRPKRLSCS